MAPRGSSILETKMVEREKLTGPDFGAGVSASSVRDSEPLLGHANGEPVLLVRRGDDFLAVGATCTHYGGPLAEGLIDGNEVRCPWHHACFDLRTGEALRSPALSPVACWTVERRDATIFVTGKRERDPLSPSYPVTVDRSAAPRAVIIVGAGAAGSAAAEMLRRCGYDGRLTIVDEDDGSPYDRPNLSKDYLAGNAPEEWIPLRPDNFYAEHRIDVVRGHAAGIDTKNRTLALDGREPLPYDALLLATGAEPIRLDVPGADHAHVHTLRSLADSRKIVAAATGGKRAVVIGGSFIGLEAAASLRTRNLEVHVVAPERLPLERILGEHLGTFVKSLHESKGVVFHLGRKPAGIHADSLTLDDGTRLEADLVVMGVGVRPRLALAEGAGLAMDRGVSVNEFLETSVPGIFAAGDIARWPDPHTGDRIRVEHWVVAQRHGQTAARNILGAREAFTQAPFFWSAHYDVSINYVGHAEKWDRVDVLGDAGRRDVAVRFMLGKKTLAVATISRDKDSLETERQMERVSLSLQD
jgi:NADPH-dependent 2,4-dienoyl-CoA reductase/sulfur reductase-like enzyme/nitrite reductase/ring-hydroxylating ferredoxin subunit